MSEIPVNPKKDIKQRRTSTSAPLSRFRGVEGQLIVDVQDAYRPAIMDGKTLGGKAHMALLESAPFKTHPTVPVEDDVTGAHVLDTYVLAKKNVVDLIKHALGGEVPEDGPTLLEQLSNKLDHTSEKRDFNLDNLDTDGLFRIISCTNTPENMDGFCHVFSQNAALLQMFLGVKIYPEGKRTVIYTRTKADSSFTPWIRHVTTQDLDLENIAYTDEENTFLYDQKFSNGVHVAGTLSGPTIESKLEHTIHETKIKDLNQLTSDGIYHFSEAGGVLNRPKSTETEFVVHVFTHQATTIQVAYSLTGVIYSRSKTSSQEFSAWQDLELDIPVGTLLKAGIVQLQNEINEAEDKAATPKAVNTVKLIADEAKEQAASNEQTVTDLTSRVESAEAKVDRFISQKYVKTVEGIAPDLEGNVTLHSASEVEEGKIAIATLEEVEAGVNNTKAVSPRSLPTIIEKITKQIIEDAFGSGSSGPDSGNLADIIKEGLLKDRDFIDALTKALKIADASLTQKGLVQLTSTLSDEETKAITPKGVKDTVTDINKKMYTVRIVNSDDDIGSETNTIYLQIDE